ncbi:MAG: hypothetical protein L3J62_04855 [Gammaproteobacteria bacterium]|nr:hypothetical protein [Gammaproteobacteria bacterium]MCF6230115.1 hypothetical protein [Gammaproteobacteria bacterium]
MKIYILAEHDELAKIAEPMAELIANWLTEMACQHLSLIAPSGDDMSVGLNLETGKKISLKAPLNFLYSLAKQHQAEFIVGRINADGLRENICFFGHEEGRPDINEIAHYLGLKR